VPRSKIGIDRVEDSGYAGKLIVIISFTHKSFIVNALSISDNWRKRGLSFCRERVELQAARV